LDFVNRPRCLIKTFTRSRDHKKNDNRFVERKNGAVVREYIGYDRLEGGAVREGTRGLKVTFFSVRHFGYLS
jgi:hypothetical protein